ncbi:hypothetical protein SMC26_39595 [Actinomadura fulvescens]|uniref:Uncharacterized protein n=1 Tax=Actinomadura fulvescens TaxID=46160 RepID=A0ABN3Q0X5_9ACTN
MQVQSKRGGVVHYSTTGVPACNPWQSDAKFRKVDDAVTCRKCIRNGYEEQAAAKMENETPAPEAEAPEAPEAEDAPVETLRLDTTELREGDVVVDHGMRVRLDRPVFIPSDKPDVRAWVGFVENLPEVIAEEYVPRSFLTRSENDPETGGMREVFGRWNVQGNELATWHVERPADGAYQAQVCQYSAAHIMKGVPADRWIGHERVRMGYIPVCEACGEFYRKQQR